MILLGEKPVGLGGIVVPLVFLLTACASAKTETQAASPGHVIVGQGTAEDRMAIEVSNQRMFDSEQGVTSASDTPSTSSAAQANPAPETSVPVIPPAAP
jgi:hypothetical protein